MKWEHVGKFLRIVEVVAIVGGVIFALIQIRDLRNNESAALMLDFNKEINSRRNPELITAIESDRPIFPPNGGEFTETEVEDLMGVYELLNTVRENGLIYDDMLYNAFSYGIVRTYNNREIQKYLNDIRTEDPSFFLGFETLAKNLLIINE